MSIGEATVDLMLNAFSRARLSLHSAEPGRTGMHELSGNRYAQQTATWERISGDGLRTTSDAFFDGLPRMDINFVGCWLDGRFLGSRPVTERKAQAGDGYRVRAGDLTVYQLMVEEGIR